MEKFVHRPSSPFSFFLEKKDLSNSELHINIPIPEFQRFAEKNEVTEMASGGITCRQCNGTGFITSDYSKESCPMCGGSGEVAAKITVEWIPNIPVRK